MSDVVLVAIIGIAGTLGGAVVAPFVERRLQERADRHAQVGAALQQLGHLTSRMVKLPRGSQEHEDLRLQYHDEVTRIELVGPKESGRIATILSMASVFIARGETPFDRSLNSATAGLALGLAMDWHRGEKSAEDAANAYSPQWDFIRTSILGTFAVNPLSDEELTPEELAERVEIQEKYGDSFAKLLMEHPANRVRKPSLRARFRRVAIRFNRRRPGVDPSP